MSRRVKCSVEFFLCPCATPACVQMMNYILSARADSIAINITLNSFDTFYNQPSHRASSRKSLYPSFGSLYPAGTEELVRGAARTVCRVCTVSCGRCAPVHVRPARGGPPELLAVPFTAVQYV
jgi:hypothetical protein